MTAEVANSPSLRMTAEVAKTPSTDDLRSTSLKASSKSRMNSEDLAAMRHLRSVIESITLNENISSSERKNNLSNFERLFTETEQRFRLQRHGFYSWTGSAQFDVDEGFRRGGQAI
ncbi:hypothetical protein ACHAW5_008087 [Stephanodiscus triporus]|uniref:Uncharacterized protein n=1 Tax=Stephanodiscus triporus TaxID=2934178 RepID=A0ABD3PTM0_9STRA